MAKPQTDSRLMGSIDSLLKSALAYRRVPVGAPLAAGAAAGALVAGGVVGVAAAPLVGPETGVAGARPLVSAGEGGDTKKIARDDVIEIDAASGLISIMGGKWTTHRAMAEDTINAAQKALGIPVTESPTRSHLLYGADGFTADLWEKLAAAFPISKETGHHLASKF